MIKSSPAAGLDQTSVHEPSADPATLHAAIDTTDASCESGNVDDTDATVKSEASLSANCFGQPSVKGEVGTLGPYRLLKELGKGGMGAVYAAIDTRLDRRLALKVMLPQYATSPSARERFLREARATARVKHDHVVTVYEADERDGVPYIAMEYLEGYPLDAYLKKKGNPSFSQVLRLAADTAAGLAAAHRQGLVHRDIKPGNLWLEAPAGRIKVLDFGLARPVDTDVELTKSGAIVGTPSYMSPEQARGEKVDHRTDLFSLGAVIYRLVTGRLPFEGPNTMAVLMALATKEPSSVRELNPSVPEPLAELIHQLLAKSADARPSSADEVVKRLRAIAQPRPVREAVPATPEVVHVPIEVTAVAAANPFADIDVKKTSMPLKPASAPTRQKPRRPWLIAAGLAGMAALSILVFSGIIIKITNKDGTVVELKVPEGSKIEITNLGEPKVVKAVPKIEAISPHVGGGTDRKAAEWVLSQGGWVKIDDENRQIGNSKDLPTEPFTLNAISLRHKKNWTDEGLAHLKDCKGLKLLDLYDTPVTDAGLAYFKDFTGLTYIDLSGTAVTDAGLVNFSKCQGLQSLDLGAVKVTDAGMAHFKDCKGLIRIALGSSPITDAGISHLKDCKQLQSLGLSATFVTDAGLAHFKDCSNLTFLDLRFTSITDAGLAHFKDCRNVTSLFLGTHLDSKPVMVTNSGLAHFKGCKGLVSLAISNTRVSDAGLALFHECNNLEDVDLSGTGIKDAGLTHFKACERLKDLNLISTAITDESLALLKNCKGLQKLDLKKTKVTTASLEALKAALPKCRIEHNGGVIEPKP